MRLKVPTVKFDHKLEKAYRENALLGVSSLWSCPNGVRDVPGWLTESPLSLSLPACPGGRQPAR